MASCDRICIGTFKTLFTIEERTEGLLSTGEKGLTYANKQSMFGLVKTITGWAKWNGGANGVKSTHVITTRYLSWVDTSNTIMLNNERYSIDDVENVDEKNKYLKLYCSKWGKKT